MKKISKKLLILLTTVLLVMTNVGHVFAEVDRNKDVATLEITGLDGGETVDLYQLVTATYNSEGDNVDHYNLNSNLADADAFIVLREEVLYEDGDTIPQGESVGDVKVPEVRVKIADLPVNDNGKIKSDTITGKDSKGEDYSISFDAEHAKVVDKTSGAVSEKSIINKLPFSTSAPTEKQVSAISADIVNNPSSWTSAKKAVDGTVTVNSTNKKWSVNAYAAADEDSVDDTINVVKPAIYDATGIYLGRINAAEDSDTVYNPVIVSAGYKNESGQYNYTANNIDAATDTYDSPSVAAKKSSPDVDKSVTGGYDEIFKCPIVATDLNGDPLYANGSDIVSGYVPNADPTQSGTVNINPDKLVYIKKGSTQTNVDEALAKADATEKAEALAACTTTSVEEASYPAEDPTNPNKTGALGTKFTYELKPTLPSYPENAVNKTLWFSDDMSTGLDYVDGSLEVKLNKSHAVVTKAYNPDTKTYVFNVTPYNKETVNVGDDVEGLYEYADNAWKQTEDQTAQNGKEYFTQGATTKLADAIDNTDGFNINYVYDAIPEADREKGGLIMNYQAVINKKAFKGVKGNPNVVTMKYANNPDTGSTHKSTDRPNDKGNKEKYDKEIVYTYEVYFKKVDGSDSQTLLKDAVFGLYADADISYTDGTLLYAKDQLICTIQTNNDGIGYTTEVIPGKYYLKEITPPKNYQKNNNEYRFEVKASDATKEVTIEEHSSWEYTTDIEAAIDYKATNNPQARLAGYLVDGNFYDIADYPTDSWVFDVVDSSSGKGTLTNSSTGQVIYNAFKAYVAKETHVRTENLVINPHTSDDPINRGWIFVADIPNTKTPELPATGGIGTYLFTIAGVAIIATAAFMLIFRKKENH